MSACSNSSHRMWDELTGCAKDEVYNLFEDFEKNAKPDDSTGPVLTMPAPGMTVPFSPKARLQWNQDPNDPGMPTGDVPYVNGPGCMDCCPQFDKGALTTLHEPPVSGNAYDLQFYIGNNYVHRVITTLQEWMAPDDLWQSWKGQTISVKIYRAQVLTDTLKMGPFVATKPSTFSVGN
jgi:hypothetical protein